ncbi:permease [human gut metagenome]|uniref:Permease n=1 Tax=human gut metagenome TaxID=408170 RepID=K1SC93_9ZZZZ
MQRYGIDTEKLSAHFAALDWKSILQSISSEMNTVISSVANVAGSTVSAIADVAISLVITFYVLIGWRELSSQSKRALYAYCKESVADRICHISKLAHDTYAKFLSGQCVEVMILGTLIFLSLSVAGIPYAGLTAVLTAAFAFVPYIGGFLSCAFGILFTLLAAPNKALLCLIVYQATQFVENQFIYPHVVGNSVGLSPFWTLLAVLLGGKLFGVLGMIFFIPLMALVSQLLHESIERRLHTRKPELSNVQSNSDENTDISQ